MSYPAVCFGSPSPEHDISILTGLQAVRSLQRAGDKVAALYWAKSGAWYEVPAETEADEFANGIPNSSVPVILATGTDGGFYRETRRGKKTPIDISAVVNCCHGVPGEDGTLQAVFDLAGLKYTGPSQWGAACGMGVWIKGLPETANFRFSRPFARSSFVGIPGHAVPDRRRVGRPAWGGLAGGHSDSVAISPNPTYGLRIQRSG